MALLALGLSLGLMNSGLFIPVITGSRKPQAPPPTAPTQTLYVRNLNEQINHSKLKSALLSLFSSFGKILDFKIKRNIKHRGQAFISFASQEMADKVMNELQSFELFGKLLDIQYSREESFAVSELYGVAESHKQKRSKLKEAASSSMQPAKKIRQEKEEIQARNAILFVQNLPIEISQANLETLFQQFPGFKEVRMVPGKPDIAFVEYQNEVMSVVAKKTLHGFRITPDREIKVSFAKK